MADKEELLMNITTLYELEFLKVYWNLAVAALATLQQRSKIERVAL